MELPTVKIVQELFELSWCIHVFEVGEQIHMSEGIDCNQWEVGLSLAKMVKRMSKSITVGNEEIDVC